MGVAVCVIAEYYRNQPTEGLATPMMIFQVTRYGVIVSTQSWSPSRLRCTPSIVYIRFSMLVVGSKKRL